MKGYVCPLYILPFDHRSTFTKKLRCNKLQVTSYKKMIFEAFELTMEQSHCPACQGILVDEKFGEPIIKEAVKKQYNFAMPVEKSGQQIFKFEFGNKFGEHLEKHDPTFAKALVRYNPANKKDNVTQLKRLKKLNDFCDKSALRLMLEPLIPPTKAQLKKVSGSQRRFDKELKLALTIKMIKEIHAAGIEPDLWKLEALETQKAWKEVADEARRGRQRRAVGLIVLGRGENKKQVDLWIKTAASTGLVNGFAIGRTIFFKPLEDYRDKKIKRAEAVEQIAQNYLRFISLWRKHAKNKKDTCICPM